MPITATLASGKETECVTNAILAIVVDRHAEVTTDDGAFSVFTKLIVVADQEATAKERDATYMSIMSWLTDMLTPPQFFELLSRSMSHVRRCDEVPK
jgi:hypothetical protein